MTFASDAQSILNYITEQAGIEALEFDEEGRAFFSANELTFLFYALEEERTMVIAIYIGQPHLDDADLLYAMLCGNHMWELTGGGTLSIDKDTGHLTLHHQLEIPLDDVSDIEPIMGNLLGAAEYWKGILSLSEKNAISLPDSPDTPDMQHFLRV